MKVRVHHYLNLHPSDSVNYIRLLHEIADFELECLRYIRSYLKRVTNYSNIVTVNKIFSAIIQTSPHK